MDKTDDRYIREELLYGVAFWAEWQRVSIYQWRLLHVMKYVGCNYKRDTLLFNVRVRKMPHQMMIRSRSDVLHNDLIRPFIITDAAIPLLRSAGKI